MVINGNSIDIDLLFKAIIGICACVAAFQSWRNKRAIQEVHVLINHRLDQLLAATGSSEHAAGMQAERDAQAQRDEPPFNE